MGTRITHLTPMSGFCAEGGGALALFVAIWLGIPFYATYAITGSIVCVGAAKRVTAVRWGVPRSIVVARVVSLPAAALVAATCYWLTRILLVRQPVHPRTAWLRHIRGRTQPNAGQKMTSCGVNVGVRDLRAQAAFGADFFRFAA